MFIPYINPSAGQRTWLFKATPIHSVTEWHDGMAWSSIAGYVDDRLWELIIDAGAEKYIPPEF